MKKLTKEQKKKKDCLQDFLQEIKEWQKEIPSCAKTNNISISLEAFNNYDLKIQPKKGQTLIWLEEWTHTYKVSIIDSGNKYIITGHFNFAD